MPTIEELDQRIEERRQQIARYEARKKAILAKEREQARKWKAATLTAVGEAVLRAMGCDWTQIDMESLQSWLYAHAADLRSSTFDEVMEPKQAKDLLDKFKRSVRTSKDKEEAGPEPKYEAPLESDSGQQTVHPAW